MYTPSLHLLSQASTVLRVYRTSCIPFGFLSRFLGLVPIPFRENAGSQLFCTKSLSKTSPGSQTGGCHDALTIAVAAVLPAVSKKTSAISNLIIISRLNHFTFVPALSFPVLRLNLALPLRLQGLGTGGWLGLTRWAFPTQFRQLTNASRPCIRSQGEISYADFSARTFKELYPTRRKNTVYSRRTSYHSSARHALMCSYGHSFQAHWRHSAPARCSH